MQPQLELAHQNCHTSGNDDNDSDNDDGNGDDEIKKQRRERCRKQKAEVAKTNRAAPAKAGHGSSDSARQKRAKATRDPLWQVQLQAAAASATHAAAGRPTKPTCCYTPPQPSSTTRCLALSCADRAGPARRSSASISTQALQLQ